MSTSRGVSVARSRNGDRFYNPPAMRRLQQQTTPQKPPAKQREAAAVPVPVAVDTETRIELDDCASSNQSIRSFSPPAQTNLDNLDRFLEYTTPMVQAHYFSKTSMRGWRNNDRSPPYFVLGNLWESFKEWSAYGVGVPLLLNGSDSIIQYYVPYLSGIQLYIDPSKPSPSQRRLGEESDAESSRETSSDESIDCDLGRGTNGVVNGAWSPKNLMDANAQTMHRPLRDNFTGSIEEPTSRNPPGLLMFEYLEQDVPYSREPLADKISTLATRFPELKTYRSCDLSSSSWISVSWYPIYRIPTGPTLQNLDGCFLTLHSLSTPLGSKSSNDNGPSVREVSNSLATTASKISLPTFGLATYKFKSSVWNPSGVGECQKTISLIRAADTWLRRLHVNHPDYNFFISHEPYWSYEITYGVGKLPLTGPEEQEMHA